MTTITVGRLTLRRRVVPLPWDSTADRLAAEILLDDRTLDEWVHFLAPRTSDQQWAPHDEPDDVAGILRGEHAEPGFDGRSELYVCSCTVTGCSPLLARIRLEDGVVLWDDFAHGSQPTPIPDLEFRFERANYDQAVADYEDWRGPIL